MSYCCSVWGRCSSNSENRLFKFQKRAARIIFDKPIDYPYEELFTKLKWLNFNHFVKYRTSLQTFKSMHNLAPPYLKTVFTTQSYWKNNLGLRNTPALIVPNYKTALYEKSFSVQGAKLYIDIVNSNNNASNFSKFKEAAFNYFFSLNDF